MKQKPGTFSARGESRPARMISPGSPGPLEDFRQDQHGHVAAHAVTLAGDFHQLGDHGFLRGRVAVVELQRVRPPGE